MRSILRKTIIPIPFLLGLIGFAVSPAAAVETYTLDPTNCYVVFRIMYLGVGYTFGGFQGPTGKMVFDDNAQANSWIEMQVQASMVSTLVSKRDNHIKSADFLNADKYPAISFQSRSVRKAGNNQYEIVGDLMLLGKKQPLTVTAVKTGEAKDPWGNYRVGFETAFTIKRSEFGMDFMLNGLSDEVQLTVSVQGVRQ